MRECQLRRWFQRLALVAAMAVASGGVPAVVTAQVTDPGMDQQIPDRDDDMDWGWIGLLGLAGLLGLRRRDRTSHVDTTPRRP